MKNLNITNFLLGGITGGVLVVCVLFTCVSLFVFSIFNSVSTTISNIGNDSIGLFAQQVSEKFLYGDQNAKDKFLLINIDGVILNERPREGFSSFFLDGVVFGYEVKDKLISASKDEDIKGVIVKVSSPGGTITGSQAILDGLKYFKEKTNKPIYGFGSGMVASGGYWAMMGVDKIFLDLGTLVGSIGVINGELTYFNKLLASGELVTEGGIEFEYITAGESKDLGNPFRRATAKEREILQKGADEFYNKFLTLVSEKRNIPKNVLRDEIGAHVYVNDQAISLNLADETANREEVINKLAEELSLKTFKVIEYKNGDALFGFLLGAFNANGSSNPKAETTCIESRKVLAIYGSPTQVCKFF